MRKASLAHTKAHLSELVDAAEHHGKRILILRHGKPPAAIVPVDAAVPAAPRTRMSKRELARLFEELARYDDPNVSAVEDLIQSRAAAARPPGAPDSLWTIAGIADDRSHLIDELPVSERADLYLADAVASRLAARGAKPRAALAKRR